jgi:murein DD-endopeptidase MepM/ murein hydrolase activator NlpD
VIQSTAPGTVVGSGWQPGFGWCVLIHHPGGYSTLYAHLSALLVEVGDQVALGAPLAYSGSSGNSTGPHLHYEIWKDGRPVDPRPFMDGVGG